MKKIIFAILIFFLLVLNVKAVTIQSFACEYTIKDIFNTEKTLGKTQIMISNYEDGNGSYSCTIYYEDQSGNWKQFTGTSVLDYKNSNDTVFLTFFNGGKVKDKKVKEFVSKYTEKGDCPTMYSNWVPETSINVDYNNTNQDNYASYSADKIFLRKPGDDTWYTKDQFYKKDDDKKDSEDDKEESNLKELNCQYDMLFDSQKTSSKVIFKRNININTNKYVYSLSVDGNEATFTTLDEIVYVPFGKYTGGTIRVKSNDLKKILGGDSCLDKNKIYHYLEALNADNWIYYITTDAKEAESEGIGGRAGTGDGTKTDEDFQTRDIENNSLGISEEVIPCNELLGENLIKIVHLFITILRIGGAVLAIVKAMMELLPAITKKDADALKKAGKTCVIIAIILCVIGIFPSLISLIGKIAGFDLTCL